MGPRRADRPIRLRCLLIAGWGARVHRDGMTPSAASSVGARRQGVHAARSLAGSLSAASLNAVHAVPAVRAAGEPAPIDTGSPPGALELAPVRPAA